ncbi:MAG: hypothetical protein KC442_18645, partial [Thermomicrobiales bacterium]|nr:hypothetical protein [Thermomicrobiales bacterium]
WELSRSGTLAGGEHPRPSVFSVVRRQVAGAQEERSSMTEECAAAAAEGSSWRTGATPALVPAARRLRATAPFSAK